MRSILRLIVWSFRSPQAQALEIVVLRHQLEILRRQVGRPSPEPRDRLLLAAASRLIPRRRWRVFAVWPETLLRWHRYLVTRRATRWGSKSGGRPPLPRGVRDLILRFAKDNPRWGYKRIQGELRKFGHEVSAMTVRDVLRRSGLGPAPRRGGPTWTQFLRAQATDGIDVFKTPIRSPRANAVAERWVKSVKTECLDWLHIGERHLRAVLSQYVDHHNRSRPHRALDLETPESNEQGNGLVGASRVCRRTRLGGLISEYYQAA